MNDSIRIDNGLLVTMAPDMAVIKDASVLIRDGQIAAVGKTADVGGCPARTVIDAAGQIILPGLVNCHTHMPMSMFRGLADDLPLDVWLNEHIFPAEACQLNPGSVEQWAAHSCREMLLAGTTTCCDGYFYEANVAAAVLSTGIRAVAGQGVIDFPAPGVPDPAENLACAVAFVKQFSQVSALLSPSIFCHSPYTCSAQTLSAAKKAAQDLGVLFQIHVAETRQEAAMIKDLGERSIVEYLNALGILDENTLMVHAIWIDDADIAIIKDTGAKVAHCPESNMKLASGIAKVPRMIDHGISVGLGTDGCASNNDHDLFAEMDVAAKLHKVALMDPCAMDAKTTLKMATCDGAAAIGLDHLVGSIAVGRRADIILVDMDKPHLIPMFDPYSSLVYSAKSSDVTLVMVDGKIRVSGGSLVPV